MSTYEELLKATGPVALTIKEYLEPVQGAGSVLFPATFAPPEDKKDEKPSYVIDSIDLFDPKTQTYRATSVGLIDTVGSQANRIEPIFKQKPYSDLIPPVTVSVGDRSVNLLDAGHRAADAIVRFSDHAARFQSAFEAIRDRGDSLELAKIAPTTIIFGGWDSRGTKVKLPRILGSVIRAWGVQKLTRSAQFFSSFEKEETEQMGDQKALSSEGMLDSPSGRGPGGVIAHDGVIREATLNLIVLRSLASNDPGETVKLQRYILGLALVAMAAPAELFLREGCLLVRSDKEAESSRVYRSGKREKFRLDEEEVLAFAQNAAREFGVGEGLAAKFDGLRMTAAAEARSAKKPKAAK